MWRNNFKIAIRTLSKDKFYSVISILGLSISIAFCLLMTMYLKNDWTYDQHHQESKNVYRLVFDNYVSMGNYASTPLPIGPALIEDFPEIESMTRLTYGFKSLVRFNNNNFFETMTFVDTGLVDIFNMDFIYGDPNTALVQPNQIILSESTAKKYFGNSNPVGKVLEIGSTGSLNSTVSAVFKDFPQNTHTHIDLAMPFSTFSKVFGEPDLWQQMPRNYTYFRLTEGQKAADFKTKLPAFAKRHVGEDLDELDLNYKMNIQNISDIHLSQEMQNDIANKGDVSSLYLLGFIALLVLLIACINYVNYATARFTKRAKEVGVRKVIGAGRKQLISQFLLETFVLALSAGAIAFLFAHTLIPTFNVISGKEFITPDLIQYLIIGSLGALVLVITLGAGIFPALFLSGFKPIEVLKGKFSNVSLPHTSRKYLVTLQFASSIVLLISTMVVYSQMQFARMQFNPGSDDQVVLFQTNSKINDKFEVLKDEILKQPGIASVTAGSNMPTFYGDSWPLQTDLEAEPVQTENYVVDDDFIETLGFQLIAGRNLEKRNGDDQLSEFVLNETATKKLGYANAEDAIGETLFWGSENKRKGNVVGVIKDFHFQSLHDAVEPAIIQYKPFDWYSSNFVAARVKASEFSAIQHSIQNAVRNIDPKWTADIKFLDDNFQTLHQKDIQQGQIFGAFSLLAILISCLGLLGLTAFATERRSKEIGIRKVLGASVSNIVALISKEFLALIVLAFLISIPLSWMLMNSWLSNFVYRIDIQWWMFLVAGCGVLLIAFLTVSFQSVKAALTNPVDSLRSE